MLTSQILIKVYVIWKNGDVVFLLCKDKYSLNSVTYETLLPMLGRILCPDPFVIYIYKVGKSV